MLMTALKPVFKVNHISVSVLNLIMHWLVESSRTFDKTYLIFKHSTFFSFGEEGLVKLILPKIV